MAKKFIGVFLGVSLLLPVFSTVAYAEGNVDTKENVYVSEETDVNVLSESAEDESVKEQVQENLEKPADQVQEENTEKTDEVPQEETVEKSENLLQENASGEEKLAEEEKEITYEAMIENTSYTTLKEALLAGGEVKLLKDVSVDEIIEITKDTTLDLGDFTITDNAPKRPFIVKAENFTIKANKGGMVIPESNKQAYGFVEAYVNNFSILGGNYTGNTDNGRLFRMNAPESRTGTINIKGIVVNTNNEIIGHKGTFTNFSGSIADSEFYTDTRALYFDVIDITEASTLTISNTKAVVDRGPVIEVSGGNTVLSDNDWNVTGNYAGGYSWARAAVGVGYKANVTIKSGTYWADSEFMKDNEGYGVYIYTSGGTVNIEGGNFAGTTASLRADVDKGTYNNPANIIVNGGEFKGDLLAKTNTGIEKIVVNNGNFEGLTDATLKDNNVVQIEGGVFDLDVIKKVSEGKETIAVTKNNEKDYYIGKEKVKEALDNVSKGDKVDILQNVTDINVPDGVEVENSTGTDVTVNGDVIKDNETVIVDEIPTAKVTYSNNSEWTNKDVTVTIKASEAIKDITGWTKVDETTFTKVFTDNATETLMITDMTNNSIQVKIDVKNIDKYAPEIRGIKDVTLVQGEKFDPLEGIFAYDNECGELKNVKVTPSSIDTYILGVYELEYTVSDLANNITTVKRTVTVNPKEEILNHAPAISAKDVTLKVGDTFDPLAGVVATDKEDGTIALTKENVIVNDVNTSKAGIYHVTYKVTDKNGAVIEKTITVTVKEKTTSKPTDQQKPEKPQKPNGQAENPKTGDMTKVGVFASMFVGSAAALAILAGKKRKRNKKDK